MHGLHLTADLHGCSHTLAAMTEPQALQHVCVAAVMQAGLQPVGQLFHGFAPCMADGNQGGVTGVVLLAESHVAVHTWPELNAVTLDVYVCNFGGDNSARAHRLLDDLIDAFKPDRIERHAVQRGGRSSS